MFLRFPCTFLLFFPTLSSHIHTCNIIPCSICNTGTELEPPMNGNSEDNDKPILHTFWGRLEGWINLLLVEWFWFSAPVSDSSLNDDDDDGDKMSFLSRLYCTSNVLDGIESTLHEKLISYLSELASNWRDHPGLGCTPESLEFEMVRALPEWMESNEMVRSNRERMKTLARRLKNGMLSHTMARLFITRYRVVETLTNLLGLRPDVLMKRRVHALETENAALKKTIEVVVDGMESGGSNGFSKKSV